MRFKRILVIIGISVPVVFICSLLAIHIWIGLDVRKNINIAKQKYPGTAEEALISFLQDENNSYHDRTHIAIWTLGQIKSGKALPLLKSYYKNDPKGLTCYRKHNSVLCQYELHKAIVQIESKWVFTHPRLRD